MAQPEWARVNEFDSPGEGLRSDGMSGMSETFTPAERRQFGRRPVNANATAVLPGGVEVPCVIKDLSDGGALLHFSSGVAPVQSFVLSVDDTPHNLKCEIRHRNGPRIGVMFTILAQGIALNRELQRPPVDLDGQNRYIRAAAAKPATACSVRELRRAVIGDPSQATASTEPSTSQAPITDTSTNDGAGHVDVPNQEAA